jgi:oxygen-independent coproporphyrinogen-3 oxidase
MILPLSDLAVRGNAMKCVIKRNEKDLIGRSKKVLEETKINKIWRAGIRRDPTKYHISVMYPPLKVMKKITDEQIFSNFQNKSKEFTLYIHIPFCSGRCTFCYFYQIEKPENGIIPEDQFQDLLNSIRQKFEFSRNIEITVEIHPEIIRHNGLSLLESYYLNQVNRLNVGIQSFDDHILEMTNRRHTVKEAIEAFELARKIGFENINIDLLYPLPDLTPRIWEKTLNIAFDLKPESITTYFTAFRKSSSIYKLLQNSPNRFPNEYMNHLFRVMTMEKAKEEGYNSRELIDWFVKPRETFHYEHQKSEAQKSDEIQLLSFGSGVFTYLNHYQYYNYPDIHKYCHMLNEGKLPIWKGIKLSKEERLARAMVLGIKSGVVNINQIENVFKEDVNKNYNTLFENLQSLGLLEKTNGSIKLSEKGILFADEIATQFISEDIKRKLKEENYLSDPEVEMINTYNFMYDTEGMSFL